jgi:glycosyltransferase involved in cell wall biosynthesis
VAVVLATYNGARYLGAQLDSLAAQTLPPALVLVSDDGSTDGSRDLVHRFADANPGLPVRLLDGPRCGAAQNFLSLLRAVPETVDCVAVADQDDVWLPGKLDRGARALHGSAAPTLYCGATWVCDAGLGGRRMSRLPRRSPGFRHALVQNIAGGNTMMLNRAALTLVQAASREPEAIVVHDWWLYQIITGAGGQVVFDPTPLLLYRQHGSNLIGANHGLAAQGRRMLFLLSGRFRGWNDTNLRALAASAHRLTPENREILEGFAALRDAPARERLRRLRHLGLYRDGMPGRASLWVGALLGKL